MTMIAHPVLMLNYIPYAQTLSSLIAPLMDAAQQTARNHAAAGLLVVPVTVKLQLVSSPN